MSSAGPDQIPAFVMTVALGPYQNSQASGYSYDKRRNLVWSGYGNAGAGPIENLYVCQ